MQIENKAKNPYINIFNSMPEKKQNETINLIGDAFKQLGRSVSMIANEVIEAFKNIRIYQFFGFKTQEQYDLCLKIQEQSKKDFRIVREMILCIIFYSRNDNWIAKIETYAELEAIFVLYSYGHNLKLD